MDIPNYKIAVQWRNEGGFWRCAADAQILGSWKYYIRDYLNEPTEMDIKEFKLEAKCAFDSVYKRRSIWIYRVCDDFRRKFKTMTDRVIYENVYLRFYDVEGHPKYDNRYLEYFIKFTFRCLKRIGYGI